MDEIRVKTKLGTILVYETGSPEYPGIWIDLERDGQTAPLAVVEYTETEADFEKPAIITRVWGDVTLEDYSDRVIHKNIEEFFREDEAK